MFKFFTRSTGDENKVTIIPHEEETTTKTEPEQEEWIWVEGYKGTKADMTCHGFQYELGTRFDMPDDADIEECCNGFHLCMELSDVFSYYIIGDDHRFFKVRALVRAKDAAAYGKHEFSRFGLYNKHDKLVAKSIEFISEIDRADIIATTCLCDAPDKYKEIAFHTSVDIARHCMTKDSLIACGYSDAFADLIIHAEKTSIALAVGSQPGLSMDMKVSVIFYGCK